MSIKNKILSIVLIITIIVSIQPANSLLFNSTIFYKNDTNVIFFANGVDQPGNYSIQISRNGTFVPYTNGTFPKGNFTLKFPYKQEYNCSNITHEIKYTFSNYQNSFYVIYSYLYYCNLSTSTYTDPIALVDSPFITLSVSSQTSTEFLSINSFQNQIWALKILSLIITIVAICMIIYRKKIKK